MKNMATHNHIKGFNDLVKRIKNNEWKDYDFTKSIYTNNRTKLEISCSIHGIFWIRPDNLKQGKGCSKCARNSKKTYSSYASELKQNFPDFRVLGEYTNFNTKILHKHVVCGHTWEVKPGNIMSGHGCPKCASYGFDPTQPAILYYLSVKNGEAYKIGITNRSVSSRYSNDELLDIEVLREWRFEVGQEAYEFEQLILERFKHLKYLGKDLLKIGNTELFKENVLNEDTSNSNDVKINK